MGRLVRVRGAGAVGVARDELLALLAFVVHRVAQRARDRHQEANERDAENENGAREVRESIYIVQNTCRRHAAHQYDRIASSKQHGLKIVVHRPNGVAKLKQASGL